MMMLYHEDDEYPEMRSDPITPEKHEQVISGMAGYWGLTSSSIR
jgi:hypothetical protein